MNLLGQAGRFEHHAQQRQSHIVVGAGTELSRCRMKSAKTLALSTQLLEQRSDPFRQMGQRACGGAIRKGFVNPKGTQHLG